MSSMSEDDWWYLLTKNWRAETLRPRLELDNIKSRLKCCIFKCISWLKGCFFGCWWLGVFWKREPRPTVKGSNFRPHGNFWPFLARFVASLGWIITKNEQNWFSWSKVCPQLSLSSFFCRTRFDDSNPYWKKKSKVYMRFKVRGLDRVEWHKWRLWTRPLVFCLHVYSPWCHSVSSYHICLIIRFILVSQFF